MAEEITPEQNSADKYDFRKTEVWPPCDNCAHLLQRGTLDWEQWTCKAYPDGIPVAIMIRSADHIETHLGQEGEFVFESVVEQFDDGPHKITFNGNWYPADGTPPTGDNDPVLIP